MLFDLQLLALLPLHDQLHVQKALIRQLGLLKLVLDHGQLVVQFFDERLLLQNLGPLLRSFE